MTGVEPHELSKLSNDLILTPQRRMEHVQGFVNEMRRKHDQNKKLGGDALGLSFQSMLDLEGQYMWPPPIFVSKGKIDVGDQGTFDLRKDIITKPQDFKRNTWAFV